MLSSRSQAVGLLPNPGTLSRWMEAGPEVVRMVNDFGALQSCDQITDHRHHEHPRGPDFLLERSEVFGCCNGKPIFRVKPGFVGSRHKGYSRPICKRIREKG